MRLDRVLFLSFVLTTAGCQQNSAVSTSANALLTGPCVDPAAIVLHESTIVRTTGAPLNETRTFVSQQSGASPTLCVEATHVSSGTVKLNGTTLLSPSSFHNDDETFVLPFELLAQNTIALELGGKPCQASKPAECATLHVRAVVLPVVTAPPIIVGELRPLNACCSDPTCDRRAFASGGGVCPGDPRIRGPLPVEAPVAEGLEQEPP